MKQCDTHTTTMAEEDNTEPVTVLISKMAAKHLTRVLFLSAFSSAISSSLSRSCSRQTFSSLVNTANSCGTHKLRSEARKQTTQTYGFNRLSGLGTGSSAAVSFDLGETRACTHTANAHIVLKIYRTKGLHLRPAM